MSQPWLGSSCQRPRCPPEPPRRIFRRPPTLLGRRNSICHPRGGSSGQGGGYHKAPRESFKIWTVAGPLLAVLAPHHRTWEVCSSPRQCEGHTRSAARPEMSPRGPARALACLPLLSVLLAWSPSQETRGGNAS